MLVGRSFFGLLNDSPDFKDDVVFPGLVDRGRQVG